MSERGPSYNVHRSYTVVGLNTQGPVGEVARILACAGAIWAETTCTVVAGANSGTSWLVAFHTNPFQAIRVLQAERVVVGDPEVKWFGRLRDYFGPGHEGQVHEWRKRFDPFYAWRQKYPESNQEEGI